MKFTSKQLKIIAENKREYLEHFTLKEFTCVNVSIGPTLKHELKKVEVALELRKQGFAVITEAKLKGKKFKPDVLRIDTWPMEAYEIMVSESDSSIAKKEKQYDGIVIRKVKIS